MVVIMLAISDSYLLRPHTILGFETHYNVLRRRKVPYEFCNEIVGSFKSHTVLSKSNKRVMLFYIMTDNLYLWNKCMGAQAYG